MIEMLIIAFVVGVFTFFVPLAVAYAVGWFDNIHDRSVQRRAEKRRRQRLHKSA